MLVDGVSTIKCAVEHQLLVSMEQRISSKYENKLSNFILYYYNLCSLQPNLAMSQTFVDVCPLLDQPLPGVNYQQPILVNRNIELVTRNLPPEVCYGIELE